MEFSHGQHFKFSVMNFSMDLDLEVFSFLKKKKKNKKKKQKKNRTNLIPFSQWPKELLSGNYDFIIKNFFIEKMWKMYRLSFVQMRIDCWGKDFHLFFSTICHSKSGMGWIPDTRLILTAHQFVLIYFTPRD